MLTVTNSKASVACRSMAALRKVAKDSKEIYPPAAEWSPKCLYVVDLLSGADFTNQASSAFVKLPQKDDSARALRDAYLKRTRPVSR